MKTIILQIQELEYPSTGIAYLNNKKVKLKNTLPGQIIEAKVNRGKARLIQVVKPSEKEIISPCPVFGQCGGCRYQNISHDYELELKEEIVIKLFKDQFMENLDFSGIETCGSSHYRNKMEYSFGDEYKGGPLALGLRKINAYYEVINSEDCNIVDNDFVKILFFVQNFFKGTNEVFYSKTKHTGTLRHLVIRKGINTKEILINLVTTSGISEISESFVKGLVGLPLDSKIVSIMHTTNNSMSDVVQIDKIRVLYGQNFYTDTLLGLKFKIYPMTFFQTNTKGAELLYSIVKSFVQSCSKRNIIYDLYCGTGTIAQILSDMAERVYGIDLVADSIQAAKENAEYNNIKNCRFLAGDVKDVVQTIGELPDIVVVDPPREGLTPKALARVAELGAPYIIYISCKPTSMVRDIEMLFQSGYRLSKLKPVDMFPKTAHVEAVALLQLHNS